MFKEKYLIQKIVSVKEDSVDHFALVVAQSVREKRKESAQRITMRDRATPQHWKCEWQLFQEVCHSKEYKYALFLHFFVAYDIWSMDVEKLTSFLLNGNRCSLNP